MKKKRHGERVSEFRNVDFVGKKNKMLFKRECRSFDTFTRGYTLIELMVIISVMLILSALAIPAFENISDRGRRHVVKEALVELRLAQNLYKHDYGKYAGIASKTELINKLGRYVKITQLLTHLYNSDLVYPVSINGEDGFTSMARAKDRWNTPVTVTETVILPSN